MTSAPNLQLAPAKIAPIPTGSVYKAGVIQGQNSTDKQMALIKTTQGGKKRLRKSRKSKKRKTRRRRGGMIKPQTFPPTYPVPAGSTTVNQNSAAITDLYAKTAANSEYDGLVGKKGGSRKYSRRRYKTQRRRRRNN